MASKISLDANRNTPGHGEPLSEEKASKCRDSLAYVDTVGTLPGILGASSFEAPQRASRVSNHSRSGSATSGFSSILGGSIGNGSFASSPVPVGMNKVFSSTNLLGSNSIAELVDGHLRNDEQAANRRPVNQLQPFKAPTPKEIPPVQLTPIEKVTKKEFSKYLTQITNEYDTFYSSRKIEASDSDDWLSTISASFSNLPHIDDGTMSPPPRRVSTPPVVTSSDDSLSAIPGVFFEQDFRLDNPRIFDIVSEKSDIIPEDDDRSDRKILANNAILQEKLSWYIDRVEMKLIKEIASASSSFFSALDDLNHIRMRAAESISRIEQIRGDLKFINEDCIERGLEGLRLHQRRHNVALLSQTLVQLATVADRAADAYSTFEKRELATISQSLDTIDAIDSLMAGDESHPIVKEWTRDWQYPIRDLRSIPGLTDIKDMLQRLRIDWGDSYGAQFTNLLIQDLQTHVEAVPRDDTLLRLARLLTKGSRRAVLHSQSGGVNTRYLDVDPAWRRQLESCLSGLVRSDNLQGASKMLTEAIFKEAKGIVRVHLPSQSDSVSVSSNMTSRSASEKSKSLAAALRNMTAAEAESMISHTYASLSELFRRFSTQQKLLLDLSLSIDLHSQSPLDLSGLLYNVVASSQTRMVKVLNVRRDQFASLSIREFLNYYTLNSMFLSECESICGENNQDLVTCLTGHIKQFVGQFHSDRDKELSNLMDKDLWKEEEISSDFQDTVNLIVSSAEKDPPQWQDTIRGILNGEKELDHKAVEQSTKKRPRDVFVENSSFIVSRGAISTGYLLQEYMKLVVAIPNATSEVITDMIELLRKYNSKTTQLILGAGATRSAGLRHITAKHLALASNGLGFLISLLPFIREFCRRHTQMTSIINEFDKARDQLTNHRNEIHRKFVSLMTDKMNSHCITISRTDWSAPSPPPGHKYILELVKDTSILVKIMNNLLPKQTYLIFDIYKRKLLEEYTKVTFKAGIEKQNMLQDVEYFKEKLVSIEGSGNTAQVLWENLRAMPVPEEEVVFDADVKDAKKPSSVPKDRAKKGSKEQSEEEPNKEPNEEPKEDSKVVLKEVPIVEVKEEPKEEPAEPVAKAREDPEEELTVEAEEEPKVEPKKQLKGKSKEEPEEHPKEESEEHPKEEPEEHPKEESEEHPKEEPEEHPKEEPEEHPKEEPEEHPKEEPKDEPKEGSREVPKDKPKDKPKEEPKEEQKEELKEKSTKPIEELEEEPEEESKGRPKIVPQENAKDLQKESETISKDSLAVPDDNAFQPGSSTDSSPLITAVPAAATGSVDTDGSAEEVIPELS